MADEKPADGETEAPQIELPPRVPLPPPPQVTYTRPTLGRAATPSEPTRGTEDAPLGSGGDSGLTKLGSGMAAATTFVASVVAGLLIGQWVDHRWGHPGGTPWGTLVFSLLGVAAGFLNLFRVLAATDRSPKQ